METNNFPRIAPTPRTGDMDAIAAAIDASRAPVPPHVLRIVEGAAVKPVAVFPWLQPGRHDVGYVKPRPNAWVLPTPAARRHAKPLSYSAHPSGYPLPVTMEPNADDEAPHLAAHALEELMQLGYTVKNGALYPPENLAELARVAAHPLTKTVRFGLSAADTEGELRKAMVARGWVTPEAAREAIQTLENHTAAWGISPATYRVLQLLKGTAK